jgi:ribose transport system ATP-binding protein
MFFREKHSVINTQLPDSNKVILSVEGITKTYQGVVALDAVSVSFRAGEVHALVGENGAGKSTLIKVISGHTIPDEGYFSIDGQSFRHITPRQAQEHGIGIVYQEPNLAFDLSVSENMFLGKYPGNGVFIDRKKMERRTAEVFEELGISIDPREIVEYLSVAQKQLVEIAKAAVQNVKLLILDEPTAPLTDKEAQILYRLIDQLKDRGVTIVYITHRLGEVYALSNRVTVLRDGKVLATDSIDNISQDKLIYLMVGRELSQAFPRRARVPGEVILRVSNLGRANISNISFSLRKGEILGVAGLTGSGRTEMVRMLYGADKKDRGTIELGGKKVTIGSPQKAIALGIGFLPEDRKRHGVLMDHGIRENMSLPILKQLSWFLFLDRKKESRTVKHFMDALNIKAASPKQPVCNLSGGNQQKVVVGKWLASSSQVLIFDEPTQGIDVGTKYEIYQKMNQITEQGISIIMVSSETEELISMSDRIMVFRDGRIAGVLEDRNQFTQGRIRELSSSAAEGGWAACS